MHASRYLDESCIILFQKKMKIPNACYWSHSSSCSTVYQDMVCVGGSFGEKLLHVEACSRFMVVSVLFNHEFTRCALEVVNLELGMLKTNPD